MGSIFEVGAQGVEISLGWVNGAEAASVEIAVTETSLLGIDGVNLDLLREIRLEGFSHHDGAGGGVFGYL